MSEGRIWLGAAAFVSAMVAAMLPPQPVESNADSGLAHAQPNTKRPRVASTIMESDELLFLLLEPSEYEERIRCVSPYSRNQRLSNQYRAAKRIRNVFRASTPMLPLALGADVAITSPYSIPQTQALWRRVGMPSIALLPATTVDAIASNLQSLGLVLDAIPRSQQLSKWLEQTRRTLAQPAKENQRLEAETVLIVQSGYLVGKGTLMHELIELVGFQNHAASWGISNHAPLSWARLISDPPDILIELDLDGKTKAITNESSIALLKTLPSRRAALTPRFAMSTGPFVMFAAAELYEIRYGTTPVLPSLRRTAPSSERKP